MIANPPTLPDPLSTIPDPTAVRQLIGQRAAELSLLRRLLKLAESRKRAKALDEAVAQQAAALCLEVPARG